MSPLGLIAPQDLESAVQRITSRSHTDENGCRIWEGCTNNAGYGAISVGGKPHYVHRLVYAAFIEDPCDLFVCHSCDNPVCVNPRHLWLGTNADNLRDMREKGRQVKGEDHGSAILKAEDIMSIRDRYIPHSRTHGGAAIAKEYSVDQALISRIVNHKIWRHL